MPETQASSMGVPPPLLVKPARRARQAAAPSRPDTPPSTELTTSQSLSPSPPPPPPLNLDPVFALRVLMWKSLDYSGEEGRFMVWLNDNLEDCSVEYRKNEDYNSSMAEQRAAMRKATAKIKKSIIKIASSSEEEIKEIPAAEVAKEISGIGDLVEDIGIDTVTEVVDALPIAGLATSLLKTCGYTLLEVWGMYKLHKVENQLKQRLYVLQKQTWLGAEEFRIQSLKMNTVELAAATTKLAANLVPVAGTVISAGASAAKIIYKVFHAIEQEKQRIELNRRLKRDGDLRPEDLEVHPILRLMIPHYPQTDALTLLGVLPPGWQVLSVASEALTPLVEELEKKKDNRWLADALGGFNPGYSKVKDFPVIWRPAIKKINDVLEESNSLLFDMPYVLKKNSEVLYMAPPQGKIQKVKYFLRVAKGRIKSGVTDLFKKFVEWLGLAKKDNPDRAAETPPQAWDTSQAVTGGGGLYWSYEADDLTIVDLD
ncbi:MAG: hypothetical protein KDD19_13995 [Phaeodactylibacter sp.]|nr:hypothetical protein [Phaeodactylibacter sp.]MCB9050774.1 hypothetical protein [Lewinellaceae bacterium]